MRGRRGAVFIGVLMAVAADSSGVWAQNAFEKRGQPTQDFNWQIGMTPSYSHGNFGTNTTSEFIYAPVSIRRLFSKGDISLVIPSVTAVTDGRTTLVGGNPFRIDDGHGSNSGPGSGGGSSRTPGDHGCSGKGQSGKGKNPACGTTTRVAGEKTTTTGIGDVILRGRYYLLEETNSMPLVAVTARVKFPTATASQGLGTGKLDHGYGIELSKLIGQSWLVFFDGGYNFIGDPDRADGTGTLGLRNQYWWDIGTGYYLTRDWLASVYFEEYRSLRSDLANARDFLFAMNYKASAAWRFNGGVTVGVSNGAPDYVVSIGTSYRF